MDKDEKYTIRSNVFKLSGFLEVLNIINESEEWTLWIALKVYWEKNYEQ